MEGYVGVAPHILYFSIALRGAVSFTLLSLYRQLNFRLMFIGWGTGWAQPRSGCFGNSFPFLPSILPRFLRSNCIFQAVPASSTSCHNETNCPSSNPVLASQHSLTHSFRETRVKARDDSYSPVWRIVDSSVHLSLSFFNSSYISVPRSPSWYDECGI